MENKVIKVLDKEHGKKVIEFWKKYCDTGSLEGINTDLHYGIINGKFNIYSINEIRRADAEIIELPEEKAYPRVMFVSFDNKNWDNQRVVFMEKCGGFMAWIHAKTLEEAENATGTCFWKYAKDLPEINAQKELLLSKANELIAKAEELKKEANKL